MKYLSLLKKKLEINLRNIVIIFYIISLFYLSIFQDNFAIYFLFRVDLKL